MRANFHYLLLQYDEAERRREMAKNSLERYTHYYERWATNESVSCRFEFVPFILTLEIRRALRILILIQ
jgi:hypothetical protein